MKRPAGNRKSFQDEEACWDAAPAQAETVTNTNVYCPICAGKTAVARRHVEFQTGREDFQAFADAGALCADCAAKTAVEKQHVETQTGGSDMQVDAELDEFIKKSYLESELSKKADKEHMDAELLKRVDKEHLYGELVKKAERTYVERQLPEKADKVWVETELQKTLDQARKESQKEVAAALNEVEKAMKGESRPADPLPESLLEKLEIEFTKAFKALKEEMLQLQDKVSQSEEASAHVAEAHMVLMQEMLHLRSKVPQSREVSVNTAHIEAQVALKEMKEEMAQLRSRVSVSNEVPEHAQYVKKAEEAEAVLEEVKKEVILLQDKVSFAQEVSEHMREFATVQEVLSEVKEEMAQLRGKISFAEETSDFIEDFIEELKEVKEVLKEVKRDMTQLQDKARADTGVRRHKLSSDAHSTTGADSQLEPCGSFQEVLNVTDVLRQELKVVTDHMQELDHKLHVLDTLAQAQEDASFSDGERQALMAALQQVQQEFHTGNQEALQALQQDRLNLDALRMDLGEEKRERSTVEHHLRGHCEELRGELVKHEQNLQELRKQHEAWMATDARAVEGRLAHRGLEVPQLRDDIAGEVHQCNEQLKHDCKELRDMIEAESASRADGFLKHQDAFLKHQQELMAQVAENKQVAEELMAHIAAGKLHAANSLDVSEDDSQGKAQVDQLRKDIETEMRHRIRAEQQLKQECDELRGMLTVETSRRTDDFFKHQQAFLKHQQELMAHVAQNKEVAEELVAHVALGTLNSGAHSVQSSRENSDASFHDAQRTAAIENVQVAQLRQDFESEVQQRSIAHEQLKRESDELRSVVGVEVSNRTDELLKHQQALKRECSELRSMLNSEARSRKDEFSKHQQWAKQNGEELRGMLCEEATGRADVLSKQWELAKQDSEEFRSKLIAETSSRADEFWENQQALKKECEELRSMLNTEAASRADELSKHRELARQDSEDFRGMLAAEASSRAAELGQHQQALQDTKTDIGNALHQKHESLLVAFEQLRQELEAKEDDRVVEEAAMNCTMQSLRCEVETDRKDRIAQCAQLQQICGNLHDNVENLVADEANFHFELQRLQQALEHEAQLREKAIGEVSSAIEQVRTCHLRKSSERQELCMQTLPAPAVRAKVLPPSLDSLRRSDLESQSGRDLETTADSHAGSLVRQQQEEDQRDGNDRYCDTTGSPASLTPPFSFSSTQGCSGGSAIHRVDDESQGTVMPSLPWDSFNTCHACLESVDEIKRELTSWLQRVCDEEWKIRAQGTSEADTSCQDLRCEMKDRCSVCAKLAEDLSEESRCLSEKIRVEVSTRFEDLTERLDSFSTRFQEELAIEKQERMGETSTIRSSLVERGIADLAREAQALRWHLDQAEDMGEEFDQSSCQAPKQAEQLSDSPDLILLLRQDLVAERDTRVAEISRLVQNFQCLENQICTQLQEIQAQITTFGSTLPAETGRTMCDAGPCMRNAMVSGEVQSEIVALRHALEQEVRLREDGIACISSTLQQMQDQMDTECKEQVAYLAERLKFVPDAKEREDASVRRLDEVSASLRAELFTIKGKHDEDHSALSLSFEDLQSQIAGHLQGIKEHLSDRIIELTAAKHVGQEGDVEVEAGVGQHIVAVEDMQHELAAIRRDLDHYAEMSAHSNEITTVALQQIQDNTTLRLGEFQSNLESLDGRVAEQLSKIKPSLQEMLTAAAHDSTPGWQDQTNVVLRRLQEQIDIEVEERSRAMAGFSEHLRSLPDALSMEVHEHVQEFREDLEAQAATMQQDLLAEREERAIEGAALRCSLQGLEGRTEEQLSELRCALDAALRCSKAFKASARQLPGCAEPQSHKQSKLQALEGPAAMVSS